MYGYEKYEVRSDFKNVKMFWEDNFCETMKC